VSLPFSSSLCLSLSLDPLPSLLCPLSSSDEIYASVNHVEPWQTGTSRNPSTCFCLLVKFFLMRLTKKQMVGLLNTDDCPFVRCIGFLYLRYSCPPKDLWSWYEPYLEDSEEFGPWSDKTVTVTMGQYLIGLLTEMQYHNTTLPRIPVPIERKYKVLLLILSNRQERRVKNQRDEERGRFCQGAKVRPSLSSLFLSPSVSPSLPPPS
jgi:pre-mRNA-splicing factor 38B